MATNDIIIESFQGGIANDRNIGQVGAFWNSKNIEYRKNSAYVELSKGISTVFTTTSQPNAITYWHTGSTITTALVVFCANGDIVTSTGVQSTVSGGSIVNVAEANGIKYLIGVNKLYSYTNVSTTALLQTFTNSTSYRPVLNFYGDLIIGDGTQLLRYNRDGTLIQWTSGTTNPVIGGLQGTIYALTQVGGNIYVWCNDGTNTILYIWNGVGNGGAVPTTPGQKIVYSDIAVKNVALLGNQHYWWASKSNTSIKHILIGESYSPQIYIKSDYPDFSVPANSDGDNNRMNLYVNNSADINAIETVNDIVMFPGYGCIYGFGKYFPGQKFSFSRDLTMTGTYITAMSSGGTTSNAEAGGVLTFGIRNGASFDIDVINFGQNGINPGVFYANSGELETMEYIAPQFAEGENNIKMTIPYECPSSATSIEVYVKYNRASSYTLIKTITSADQGTGFHLAEIKDTGKWRTKQMKFILKTTNTSVSPKLYTRITNKSTPVGVK